MRRFAPLFVLMVLAFAVRVLAPWSNVFTANGVMLQENDAWYHRRVVELIQQQWPQRPRVDPLGQPGGAPLHHAMLFDYLVAAACPGCGESARDAALAVAPPLLGTLAVALAWLIGRRLGGDRVALAMHNSPEWMVAFVAVTALGAIPALVNSRGSGEEMRFCVDDVGAVLAIAVPTFITTNSIGAIGSIVHQPLCPRSWKRFT